MIPIDLEREVTWLQGNALFFNDKELSSGGASHFIASKSTSE